jgi:hypothetical protein
VPPSMPHRILAEVAAVAGLTDRMLADRLIGAGAPQQGVNQACRVLEQGGRIRRATAAGRADRKFSGRSSAFGARNARGVALYPRLDAVAGRRKMTPRLVAFCPGLDHRDCVGEGARHRHHCPEGWRGLGGRGQGLRLADRDAGQLLHRHAGRNLATHAIAGSPILDCNARSGSVPASVATPAWSCKGTHRNFSPVCRSTRLG